MAANKPIGDNLLQMMKSISDVQRVAYEAGYKAGFRDAASATNKIEAERIRADAAYSTELERQSGCYDE